jgi:hypothetical protein
MTPGRAIGAPTQHDGKPSEPDDDVPVQPDPRIGSVVSVQTNRTRSGWKKMTQAEKGPRIGLGVVAFVVGGLLGVAGGGALVHEIAMSGYPQMMLYETPIVVVLGVLGCVVPTAFVIAAALLTRKKRATFVGTSGLMDWSAGLLGPSATVLSFDEAHELRVQRTRQFVNGGYTGTFYNYSFTGRDGRQVFRIHGSYRDTDPIPPHDQVAFAFAAERAWTKHKIAQIDRALRTEGVARFASGRDTIGIGKGFLELHAGGKIERISRPEIQSIQAWQGTLIVKRTGAKEGFFSSEGVFKFPISQMADFTVFAITLEEQLGIRLG